jgi:hypothetical protein
VCQRRVAKGSAAQHAEPARSTPVPPRSRWGTPTRPAARAPAAWRAAPGACPGSALRARQARPECELRTSALVRQRAASRCTARAEAAVCAAPRSRALWSHARGLAHAAETRAGDIAGSAPLLQGGACAAAAGAARRRQAPAACGRGQGGPAAAGAAAPSPSGSGAPRVGRLAVNGWMHTWRSRTSSACRGAGVGLGPNPNPDPSTHSKARWVPAAAPRRQATKRSGPEGAPGSRTKIFVMFAVQPFLTYLLNLVCSPQHTGAASRAATLSRSHAALSVVTLDSTEQDLIVSSWAGLKSVAAASPCYLARAWRQCLFLYAQARTMQLDASLLETREASRRPGKHDLAF